MKFLYGLYGANVPVIREFEIDKTMSVKAGTIIRCSSDHVLSPTAIGECVGVVAEDHSGKEDLLNARSNGKKLRIDVTGGGVYSVPATRITCKAECTATKIICDGTDMTASLVGSKLVLVQKGENSTNTDSVGDERTITNVELLMGNAYFTVSEGGIACEGDIYALIPYVGFKGNVAMDGENFTLSTGAGVELKVMGYDNKSMCLEVLLGAKCFN